MLFINKKKYLKLIILIVISLIDFQVWPIVEGEK